MLCCAVLCCAVLCCAVLCCAVLWTTPSLPAQLRPVSHSLLSRLMGQSLKHGQPLRPPGELRTGQHAAPLPQLQCPPPAFSLSCQAHLQLIGIQGSFTFLLCRQACCGMHLCFACCGPAAALLCMLVALSLSVLHHHALGPHQPHSTDSRTHQHRT